ncbi:helix-turn-helix domain-containing protein [Alicyclobacillus suci]|uniref:helix-turn-helix domain-containing protein n=1 Tax=Alicyclobacillus suci TaxID=2816080 RepID=UPI001A9048CF|nr:helix-turn-helix transcriptional regulator [Alicyclobacillus suci]
MGTVKENVERIRKAKGVTKTFLAKKLGMSVMGYIHITSGDVRLDTERLQVIADVLDVDPGVFFDNKLTDSVVLDCLMPRRQVKSVRTETQ